MQVLEHDLHEKGKIGFTHDWVKEAFYENIEEQERKEMHLKVASDLESMNWDSIEKISFDWGISNPEEINRENAFSIRYIMNCDFEEGIYKFNMVFDDAIKVYLDNEIFSQSWADNGKVMIINREMEINQGEHEIKVEYYEATGNASINVDWVKIN